ncbi:unnamed protein product, partial [Ixodes persulcatus]
MLKFFMGRARKAPMRFPMPGTSLAATRKRRLTMVRRSGFCEVGDDLQELKQTSMCFL